MMGGGMQPQPQLPITYVPSAGLKHFERLASPQSRPLASPQRKPQLALEDGQGEVAADGMKVAADADAACAADGTSVATQNSLAYLQRC